MMFVQNRENQKLYRGGKKADCGQEYSPEISCGTKPADDVRIHRNQGENSEKSAGSGPDIYTACKYEKVIHMAK